jgi:tetratricopeptide (TPR) repeat protein
LLGCLEEHTVAAFAGARLPLAEAGRVRRHAQECVTCRDSVLTAFARSGVGAADAEERLAAAAPREPLPAGTAVGRYTVLGLVGQGGMGEVYAAYDPGLDRRIALKLMSASAQDDNAQERLSREAQAIAKLSHPNVVIVHDVGTFGGQVFLAMEFVEGATLGAWLVERPREWREVLAMFIQAARGLAAAHAAGLVHRDFKPQNVMVANDGTARVMDFGLARRIDSEEAEPEHGAPAPGPANPSLTRTGELVGTPLYMAPEQFAGGRVDARTDQFSFCVALYWALSGVHPFGASSPAEISGAVARGIVTAPPKKIGAPTRIQKALLRGLSTDPEARWPSMDALIHELLRDPRRQQRRLAWVALAAVLAAAVGVSAVQVSRRSRAVCSAGPERLGGAWEATERAGSSSRRERMRAAVLKSGTAEPAQTWERISSLLDRYGAKWVAAYRDACEATHVRGEQSEGVLDLRMACLNDNLDSARALTDLVAAGDRGVIDHAVEAAASLEDLTSCGAAAQVRSGLRPPRDPSLRGAVDEARRKLKEGSALRQAGELERAMAIADGVLARADVASYCPVEAEALLLKGMAQVQKSHKEAVAPLERAVETGERCGHDRVVAAAMGDLVFAHAYDSWPEAERWAKLGAAVLQRMGGDPILESWLANDLGVVRWEQGRWEDARQEFERAIALKKRALAPDNPDIAGSQANLISILGKLRRFDEAESVAESALAIDRKWMASDSLLLAIALTNQGEVLLEMKRYADSAAAYREAWAITAAKMAASNPLRFEPLYGLAAVSLARGDAADAVSKLEQVVAGWQRLDALPVDLARARFKLALALEAAHRDPARARDLARQASAAYASQPSFEAQRREVEAWLGGRGQPVQVNKP